MELLSDIFINILIFLATIPIGNFAVRDKFLKKTARDNMIIGGLSGLFGFLLLLYRLHTGDGIATDLRLIPVVLMGIYFSYSASFMAAGVMSLLQIAFLGWDLGSLTGVAAVFAAAAVCSKIGRSKWKISNKWIASTGIAIVLVSAGTVFTGYSGPALTAQILFTAIAVAAFSTAVYYLITYVIRMNEKSAVLRNTLQTDFLTGLKNVRYFDDAINQYAKENPKPKENISLLFIDIDHFKKVNDQYGHLSGDIVLKEIGSILTKLSRSNDIVTRKGGEEFTVLLTGCRLECARLVAERIRISVEKKEFINENNEVIRVTVSIGVSSYPDTTNEVDKMIEQADMALYSAKRSGRNKVWVINENNDDSEDE